jgi:hypothetical protein
MQELPVRIDHESITKGAIEELAQSVQNLFGSEDELRELFQEEGPK